MQRTLDWIFIFFNFVFGLILISFSLIIILNLPETVETTRDVVFKTMMPTGVLFFPVGLLFLLSSYMLLRKPRNLLQRVVRLANLLYLTLVLVSLAATLVFWPGDILEIADDPSPLIGLIPLYLAFRNVLKL